LNCLLIIAGLANAKHNTPAFAGRQAKSNWANSEKTRNLIQNKIIHYNLGMARFNYVERPKKIFTIYY